MSVSSETFTAKPFPYIRETTIGVLRPARKKNRIHFPVDNKNARMSLIFEKLFKKGPAQTGVFATRAPARPNPIMVSTIR